jgi:hypothetical protein
MVYTRILFEIEKSSFLALLPPPVIKIVISYDAAVLFIFVRQRHLLQPLGFYSLRRMKSMFRSISFAGRIMLVVYFIYIIQPHFLPTFYISEQNVGLSSYPTVNNFVCPTITTFALQLMDFHKTWNEYTTTCYSSSQFHSLNVR